MPEDFNGSHLPAGNSNSQVKTEPAVVSRRLAELHESLTEPLLREANEHGYRARAEVTLAHPPTAAGTYHWGEFVFALRTSLAQRQWSLKNHKNCPFVLSPDKSIAILVMTGDADTGIAGGRPTNQAQKGVVLKEAVSANQQYELFELAALSKLERANNGTQMWVLLYHVGVGKDGRTEIRAELSLPSRFERKKIAGWTERILLGAIRPDGEHDVIHDVPTGPVDVPVERRQAG